MVKTLRITAILAAVLAAGFFIFAAVFGMRGDEQTEKFLKTAGAVEKFNKARGKKSTVVKGQVSPLVKQAQAFALFLNPPAKARKTAPSRKTGKRKTRPRPETVSAKFNLIGTSFFEQYPKQSLALIDEPGKGLRWVRQAGSVGHLVIEQVKDGLVTVRDGEKTFELVAERPKKTNLVKSSIPDKTASDKIILDKTAPEIAPGPGPARNEAQDRLFDEITSMLKDIEDDVEAGKQDPETAGARTDELMERLVAELEATSISPEEANSLDQLGQLLQQRDSDQPDEEIQPEPEKTDPNRSKTGKIQKSNRRKRGRRVRRK